MIALRNHNAVKEYGIAIFTQDGCKPCDDLKSYCSFLPEEQQKCLEWYPYRTITGTRSAWCEQLGVTLTPTLVVFHDDMDDLNQPVEMIIGCKAIIKALPATIEAYTYCEAIPDSPTDHGQEQEKGRH